MQSRLHRRDRSMSRMPHMPAACQVDTPVCEINPGCRLEPVSGPHCKPEPGLDGLVTGDVEVGTDDCQKVRLRTLTGTYGTCLIMSWSPSTLSPLPALGGLFQVSWSEGGLTPWTSHCQFVTGPCWYSHCTTGSSKGFPVLFQFHGSY